jgi:hypothetical protein
VSIARVPKLGLGWEDLDIDAGVAIVRSAAVYVDGVGMVLGPTSVANGRS